MGVDSDSDSDLDSVDSVFVFVFDFGLRNGAIGLDRGYKLDSIFGLESGRERQDEIDEQLLAK